MTSRRRGMRQHLTCPLCLLILCHVASTCRVCLPPMFSAAANGSPPNPNWEIDFDWLSNENQIAMARFAVAQHNATKSLDRVLHSFPSTHADSPLCSRTRPRRGRRQATALLPFIPSPLHPFSPPSLLPSIPSPLQPFSPSSLLPFIPSPLHPFSPSSLLPFIPSPLLPVSRLSTLLRGRTAFFDALLSRRPLVAAQSATPAAAPPPAASATLVAIAAAAAAAAATAPTPAAASVAAAATGGGEGGGEGWQYTLRSWVQQAGWGHASTREEQEAALRHVVPVTPPPCGHLLTYVQDSVPTGERRGGQ
ncbi:unnamed protein product [Closterium sp. Naga37s-1]|nr:unnamed protein product [Closterium sp. Naga37s-1]